ALTVLGREEDGWYSIRFTDTGRGMSEEELARLFTPFSTAFDGGTGLGMAIVRRIVEEHGGAIDAESRPGEGTTVTVLLPRATRGSETAGAGEVLARGAAQITAPRAGGSSDGSGMSKPRLLIVDDEASLREMLGIVFNKEGFEV